MFTWRSNFVQPFQTYSTHVIVNEPEEHIHVPLRAQLLCLCVAPQAHRVNTVI